MPRETPLKRPASRPAPPAPALPQALRALEAVAGPSLLVDGQGRLLAAGGEARRLLGEGCAPGAELPQLLGELPAREVEALLGQGREVVAPVAGRAGTRALRARALRTGEGWVVSLSPCAVDPRSREECFQGLWTQDWRMRRLFRVVERAAATEASVLVRGESGTGKELVARALHALSSRAAGPFRAINCAALSPSLLESELFGHVRGAFTGAVRDAPGHFRLAQGGTLFLDEVAEMPLALQAKMLRVLETRTVIPVGGREPVAVDVRIVAATHRALRREVEQGRFRADLMYRLRVVPIFLPALRERPGDILPLAERFLAELNARGGRQVLRLSAGARHQLQAYAWPGNVRELRNVMEYAHVMGEGPSLTEAELPPEFNTQARAPALSPSAPPPAPAAGEVGLEDIHAALARTGGRKAEAARQLGISRITLWRRLRAAQGRETDETP